MPKSIAEKSIETQLIEQRLLQVEEGELVTYEELSRIVSGDVQYKLRGRLNSALRIMEREHGRLFSCVHNEGVKRNTPGESVAELTTKRQRLRRHAKRLGARSTRVEWDRLTKEEQRALNAERTILHFVSNSSGDKQVAKIANEINGSDKALPTGRVLELFKGK